MDYETWIKNGDKKWHFTKRFLFLSILYKNAYASKMKYKRFFLLNKAIINVKSALKSFFIPLFY
ncbi:hypothetical protein BACI71_70595 [Bacillus mycoides]|uniref:Uncharacterized protein n=1 Tax=Bacillus mycoides TaxID=1405 RepID=A0A654BNK7_BACMY|nr:hypothetical protein BACI71_70595 [Bacillus mycoides]